MRSTFSWLKVRIAVAISVLASIGLPASSAEAYQTFSNHKLTYGVTGQKYWVAASAGTYSGEIDQGVALWNATPTPASYARTTTKSVSRMDFYGDTNPNANYCGYTWWYVNTSRINPELQNWWWARVYLSRQLLTLRCGMASHEKAIVAHEQGHVMGLDHTSLSNQLMYSDIAITNINQPQADDIAGINYLY